MSTNIRKLTTDCVQRIPWWVWLIIIFFHGLSVWLYANERDHRMQMFGAVFAVQAATYVQNRAWLQTVRTLPVSRKEIGLARWWAGIAVPGLVLTTISLNVFLATALLWNVTRDAHSIALWLAGTWATLGIWNSLNPSISYANRFHPLLAIAVLIPSAVICFPTIWPFMPGAVSFRIWLPLGLIGVVGLYAFAPYLGILPSGAIKNKRTIQSKAGRAQSKLFGLRVLIYMQIKASFIVFIIFEIIVGGISLLLPIMMPLSGKLPPSIYVMFSPCLTAVSISSLLSARMLRTLPLRPYKLTAILQLCGLMPTAISFVVILVVSTILLPKIPNLAPIFLLILSLQTLQPPIRLRFHSVQAVMLLSIIVTIGIFALTFGTFLTPSGMSGPAVFFARWTVAEIALAASIGVTGYVWTFYELSKGNRAYRPRPLLIGSAGSFSGRLAGPAT
jgi:hypothetical protein